MVQKVENSADFTQAEAVGSWMDSTRAFSGLLVSSGNISVPVGSRLGTFN